MHMRPALRSLAIITAALCIPLVPFFIIGELPGDRWLSAKDDAAGAFALAGAGLLAADALLPIPSSIVGTMLGARLGFMPGFAAAFLGMMAGQVIAYAASRYLLRHRPQALPTAPTLAVLFLSRPVPVLAEAVAFAAGAARMSWSQFLLACGAGNLVYAGALALNGAALIPGEPLGAGLVLPMLLPAIAWLAWRALYRRSVKGG
jgi:uncharacterized membrane protein YdjX (TVP38/TMEM64 family)